ncbi:MAG: undecaprenyl-phosphate glucose phosphotransferase [Porticoccaceae bacterium]
MTRPGDIIKTHDWGRQVRSFAFLTNFALIAVAGYLALFARFGALVAPDQYQLAIHYGALVVSFVLMFDGNFFAAGRLARNPLSRTLFYLLTGFGIFILCLVFFKVAERFSRAWLGLWVVFALVLVVSLHHLSHRLVHVLRQRVQPRRVAIVCADAQGDQLAKRFASQGGVVAKMLPLDAGLDAAGIEAAVKQLQIQELWISLPLASSALLRDVLYRLRDTLVDIRYFPQIDDLGLFRQRIGRFGNNLVIDLTYSPLQGGNALLKRAEDVILTCALLGILAPLCLLVAVAVKLGSPGPVLFRQYRHGADGKPIEIYKFRTMHMHTEPEGRVTQATRGDPRITPVGHFLRRTSLDELPQFVNVLQGRMSIVGPRPHALAHNEYYKDLVESYMRRHKVKPGITGWAQVNGLRGATDTLDAMKARVEHDLWYIDNWSLGLDLKIIALTVSRLWSDRNAY